MALDGAPAAVAAGPAAAEAETFESIVESTIDE
jgi:hypothetical protein